jgi:hypothetical protein
MLPTIYDVRCSLDKLPDGVLAMAAVGGLFCPIGGSFHVSLSLHTYERQLALSRVSYCLSDVEQGDVLSA